MVSKKIATLSDYAPQKKKTISDYAESGIGVIEAGPIFNGGAKGAASMAQNKTASNTTSNAANNGNAAAKNNVANPVSNATKNETKIYDPNKLMDMIRTMKYDWGFANKAGNTARQNAIAEKAKVYYQQLKDIGYGEAADELSKVGAQGAQEIINKWKKAGKTATRPYLYSIGEAYGLSEDDVDKLVSWDNQTGEVTFAGKKIGTPDAVVDGVSYWKNTSALDNAFSEYAKRSGIEPEKVTNMGFKTRMAAAGTANDDFKRLYNDDHRYMREKHDELFEYANQDVTQTDEYKSSFANIMPYYDLKALQGRDNIAAGGAASNGGNIDSFSAANALRQQMAITAQGQQLAHQMGLEAYGSRIDKAKSILANLGVENQRIYDAANSAIANDSALAQQHLNAELSIREAERAEKNDETARLSEEAAAGIVPTEWIVKNSPYFNKDGSLNERYISAEFDATGGFTTIINNLEKQYATEKDPAKKEEIRRAINDAKIAKARKTNDYPQYSQYAHEVTSAAPQYAADYNLKKEELSAAERMNQENNKVTELGINADKEVALDANAKSLEGVKIQSATDKYATDANKAVALDANAKSLEGVKIQTDANKYATDANKEVALDANAKSLEGVKIQTGSNETIAQIGADADKYGYDQERGMNKDTLEAQSKAMKELEKLQDVYSGGDTAVFTNEQKKEVDAVVKTLNSVLAAHSSNPDGKTLISYNGGGKYTFISPDGKRLNAQGWTWEIVPIVHNSGLDETEAAILYTQLGLDPEAVEDVYLKKGWIEQNAQNQKTQSGNTTTISPGKFL